MTVPAPTEPTPVDPEPQPLEPDVPGSPPAPVDGPTGRATRTRPH